jgi:ATP-dependent DNA helicase RecG
LLHPKIQNLSKPLRLEQKQDYTNHSVTGGLDRYVMRACDELLKSYPDEKDFADYLRKTRTDFGQYMALTPRERKILIAETLAELEKWAAQLPAVKASASQPAGLKPDDLLMPFVPAEKTRAFQLTKLKTIRDLLTYTPKWILNRSVFTPIAQCVSREELYFIKAKINQISQMRRGSREMMKVVLEDGTGILTWIWFNRPYLKKELYNGRWVVLHAIPEVSKWGKQVVGQAETFEFLSDEEMEALDGGKTLVMYPTTPTLTQHFWRTLIGKVLEKALTQIPNITRSLANGEALGLSNAYRQIHQPESLEIFESARRRLAFEELLVLQTYLMIKKNITAGRQKGRQYLFEGEKILAFRKSIPFQLTGAQKKVLKEIREDLARPHPMNRLLQGDVGSGKTLVAAIAFLYAADSKLQSAFMAPTEILAYQHTQTLQKLVGPVGLRVALLTSDMRDKEKRQVLQEMADGLVDVVVGTHALLEKNIVFKNLGFLVIDERHKFGVLQRAALEEKGKWPDALMMTATPFPRALVLTEYGDTDLSVLDEFPKGRKPVKTAWKSETKKEEVYQFTRERVLKGEQAFWVFPVVEQSKSFLKSATQMYQYFKNDVFHGFKVGLIHGKMKKEEKQEVMRAFVDKEIQILVSTTVVEVGVDVSNATIMVVEHAERFGLAQLHQLRGRVGRGNEQAYCFLMTSPMMSSDAIQRMKIMVATTDGFKLSEFDLKMRGPGEIFGLAQSGRREGGIVDLKRDVAIVDEARGAAASILETDPRLTSPDHQYLRSNLETKYQYLLDLAQIS